MKTQFLYRLLLVELLFMSLCLTRSLLGEAIDTESSIEERASIPSPALVMEFVEVNDACNHADSQGLGVVNEIYQMGKYEVTASDYCAFLNAVAATDDPHHLYDDRMQSDSKVACITKSVLPNGDGYLYKVIPGKEKVPITYVSLHDAERFCNWLEHSYTITDSQTENLSAQDRSWNQEITESGAYQFMSEQGKEIAYPNPEAHYFIPSQDEWIKAAYYKGKQLNSGYYEYATQHNTAPNHGNGDKNNQANYTFYASISQGIISVDALTGTVSAYGCCDMNGNVNEWTSTYILPTFFSSGGFIVRGGSWRSVYDFLWTNDLMRTGVPKSYDCLTKQNDIGFRIAARAPFAFQKNSYDQASPAMPLLQSSNSLKSAIDPQQIYNLAIGAFSFLLIAATYTTCSVTILTLLTAAYIQMIDVIGFDMAARLGWGLALSLLGMLLMIKVTSN